MGIIGILLGLLCIILFATKGLNIIVLAPIATFIVVVFNKGKFLTYLIGTENSYMAALGNFIADFFPIFMLGAILAKYIDQSGAARTIAEKIIEKIGSDNPFSALLAIYIISAVLTYGGISLFVVVFVILPLARPVFKKLDISWNIVPLPIMLGAATFTMTMMPGTPSIQNAIPIEYLGTTLTAAPILGLTGSMVSIIFSLWYMKKTVEKSKARGETYATYLKNDYENTFNSELNPTFLMSIIPLVSLIVLILIGSLFKVANILIIALVVSILLCIMLFNKYVKNHVSVINSGAMDSITPILLTSSTVAFGVVITYMDSFRAISKLVVNNGNFPILNLSLLTIIFGGITGSASGAEGIILQSFGNTFISTGISPEVIHRVTAMSSAILANMPHSGVVLTMLSLTGLSHKTGYRYIFGGFTIANGLSLFLVLILSLLFPS